MSLIQEDIFMDDKQEWEEVASGTYRLAVPGGWLYRFRNSIVSVPKISSHLKKRTHCKVNPKDYINEKPFPGVGKSWFDT